MENILKNKWTWIIVGAVILIYFGNKQGWFSAKASNTVVPDHAGNTGGQGGTGDDVTGGRGRVGSIGRIGRIGSSGISTARIGLVSGMSSDKETLIKQVLSMKPSGFRDITPAEINQLRTLSVQHLQRGLQELQTNLPSASDTRASGTGTGGSASSKAGCGCWFCSNDPGGWWIFPHCCEERFCGGSY